MLLQLMPRRYRLALPVVKANSSSLVMIVLVLDKNPLETQINRHLSFNMV